MAFSDIERNILGSVNFKIEIMRLPGVSFHSQNITIPSLQMDIPKMPTSRIDFNVAGSKLMFDPFVIEFLVDKELKNYKEVFNWILDCASTEPTVENPHKSDIKIHILTPDLTPFSYFTFVGAFPTMLSEISFNTTASDFEPVTSSLTITYDYFYIEGAKIT